MKFVSVEMSWFKNIISFQYAIDIYLTTCFNSQVGRTERLDNTLNPQFSTAIIIDYFFEELQKLKFFIYDIDSSSMSLKSADFLGEMECTLGQVVYNFLYSATSMFNSLTTLNSKWINLKLHAEISQNNYL